MSSIKRIFIIGHSGAGKGVLAQAVAKKLGWKFINADVLGCAAHIGCTVSEVVGTEGERAFNRCLTEPSLEVVILKDANLRQFVSAELFGRDFSNYQNHRYPLSRGRVTQQ